MVGLCGASALRMSGPQARSAQHLRRCQRRTSSRPSLHKSKLHLKRKPSAKVPSTQSTWRTPSSRDAWCRKVREVLITQTMSKDGMVRRCNRVDHRLGSNRPMSCQSRTTTIREGMLETTYTLQQVKIYNHNSKHDASLHQFKIQRSRPSHWFRKNWKLRISDSHTLQRKHQIISQKSVSLRWSNQ